MMFMLSILTDCFTIDITRNYTIPYVYRYYAIFDMLQ